MAGVNAEIIVRSTTDPSAFGELVAPLVEREPLQHSVLATNLARVLAEGDPAGEALWIWAEHHGRPVGAAMHIPPHPPYLCTSDSAVAVVMAEDLARNCRAVHGVNGTRVAAEAFAERWRELRPCHVSTRMEQAMYALNHVDHPAGVAGRLRLAEQADTGLLNGWGRDFAAGVGEPPSDRDDPMTGRIGDRELWVWDDQGPVSMAYASPAHAGVSRVSWVYTPPALRRRGYATACVAGTSHEQVRRGHLCMLYADLANLTSNTIYQAIGYRHIGDALSLGFEAVP